MPVFARGNAKGPSRRVLFLALGPVVGVIIGVVTNILTNRWNWWLFSILTALVVLASIAAVVLDEGDQARGNQQSTTHLRYQRRHGKDPAVNTLPLDTKYFTDRGEQVSKVLTALRGKERRVSHAVVFSIEGIGGVGKTSLAVHIAHKVARSYPDGALFIDLHGHTDGRAPISPSEAIAMLLTSLGVPGERIPDSLDERTSLWRSELSHGRFLVVLDNASGPGQIRDLLAGSDGCLLLITSRQRLTELPEISPLALQSLAFNDAATMFSRIVGVESEGPQDAYIAELIRRIGGLPLAIRIAASRLSAHPARTVRNILENDIKSSADLKRVYDLSYQDLSLEMRSFFRLLAVHPGADITAETAAMLAGISVESASGRLEELYNRYLLTEPKAHRFKFHDIVRDFVNREDAETQ